jgi:type IV pilus assembly protein PilY1
MYYYQTDLRNSTLGNCNGAAGVDVCENNVPISGIDTNDAQHLTTFTLGLGARGRMNFSSTYQTDTTSNPIRDYVDVKLGTTATTGICSWQTSGACNWPTPSSGAPENIDDLWHAAVNGRGTYFSATDPLSLSVGLSDTLQKINQVTGAAAAAATSTLNPVADNNFAYVASYTTVRWVGNLEQRTINISTGVVSQAASWCVENIAPPTCISPNTIVADTGGSSTIYYCAAPATDVNLDLAINVSDCSPGDIFDSATTTCRSQIANTCVGTLPLKVAASTDTRTIYTADNAGTALTNFDAAYATANPTNFSAAHISGLSQWSGFDAAQQTAAAGTNLINFLRGQNGYEENRTANTAANWLYRYRDAVMGDALESQPTFVSGPTFSYADAGYTDFKTANANRAGTVFIGSNDGMLHAFAASNGVERWAYVPSMVIPNMWKLADKNYATQHANFVNGSAVISDICTAHCSDSSAVWKTILVGGLNAGGRGYYALDITDPVTPTLLWELTPAQNANIGYDYGKPVITKKTDGTWVVLLTSGYDNGTLSADNSTANSPAGDGLGYLYVVNAATGSIINAISTGAGSATTPSGLARFNAYSDFAGTNQAGYVYGGDLLGNLWRFDINTAAAPLLFATLKDSSGIAQPITTAPTLGKVNGKRVIYVGTGKYLETADLTNTQQQTLYAIKDDDAITTLINPRTSLVQQTITTSTSTRTGSSNPVDLSTGRGWYVNFPDTGERANIDFKLVQGTLLVPTIVPSNTICSPGGYGWLTYFNYENGNPTISSGNVSQKYSSTIVGMNVIYINGEPIVEIVTSSNPTPEIPPVTVPFRATSTGSFTKKREIWRELIP